VYEKTEGTLASANAAAASTARVIGLLPLAIVNSETGRAPTNGLVTFYIRETDSPAPAKGDALYLSAAESGALTVTPPTGSGESLVWVGRVSNDGFLVEVSSPILL